MTRVMCPEQELPNLAKLYNNLADTSANLEPSSADFKLSIICGTKSADCSSGSLFSVEY